MEIVFQFSCFQRRKLGTVEGFLWLCNDYFTQDVYYFVFDAIFVAKNAGNAVFIFKKRKEHQTHCRLMSWLKESLHYVRNYFGVLKVGGWNFRRIEIALGWSAEAKAKPSFSAEKKSPRNSSAKDRLMQMCPAQCSTRRQRGDKTYLTPRNGHFMTRIFDFQFPIIKFWCSQEPGRVA